MRAFLRDYALEPPNPKDRKAWGAMLYELVRVARPIVVYTAKRCVENMVRDHLSTHLKRFCIAQAKGEKASLSLQGLRGKHAEVQWDKQVWRIVEAGMKGIVVRFSVGRGRSPIVATLLPVDRKGKKIREWLASTPKTVRVKYIKKDKLAVYWSVERDVADPEKDGVFLGVDLGIRQLLVGWNPELRQNGREAPPLIIEGHDYAARLRKLRDRQYALQKSGAPRKVRRVGKKISRWQDAMCREAARACVLHAQKHRCCGVRAEKLTGIREGARGPFGQRYLHQWPYHRVLHWLKVMCENTGLAFEQVSPAGSSVVCHSCGALGALASSNGTGRKDTFACSMCDVEIDRDVNAAGNLAVGGVARRWAKLTKAQDAKAA